MIGSQCIILIVFILTTSFARVNTDKCKYYVAISPQLSKF